MRLQHCGSRTVPVTLNADSYEQSTRFSILASTVTGSATHVHGVVRYDADHRDCWRRDPVCSRVRVWHDRGSQRQAELLSLRAGDSSRPQNLRNVWQRSSVIRTSTHRYPIRTTKGTYNGCQCDWNRYPADCGARNRNRRGLDHQPAFSRWWRQLDSSASSRCHTELSALRRHDRSVTTPV
jgi:hypothetical protein